jgi:hypothetical protein
MVLSMIPRIKNLLIAFGVLALFLAGPILARAEDPVLGYSNWPAIDGYPYYGQTVAYNWIDITSGGNPLWDVRKDSYTGPYGIGFNFPFYNQIFNQFYINANGFLTFEAKDPGLDPTMYAVNQCPLPDNDKPNNLIALLWGDLKPPPLSRTPIYYKSFSPCPVGSGTCLIVSFIDDWRFALSNEIAGTFQAILFDNGDVQLQYQNVGPTIGATSTNSYTVGIDGAEPASKTYGLVYRCDAPYQLSGGTAVKFTRNFLFLSPETTVLKSCNGQVADYVFTLTNYSGSGTVTVDCSPPVAGATLTIDGTPCPKTFPVGNGGSASFTATLTPPACSPPGLKIPVTLTALSGNGYSATATIDQTLYQSGIWDLIPPEPEYCRQDIVAGVADGKIWSITGKGASEVRVYDPAARAWSKVSDINFVTPLSLDNFARSGCQHGSKVYFFGDTDPDNAELNPNFSGLWSFDMSSKTIQKETAPGGPPYSGTFAPAWAYDPEAGLCYLTGGGESPTNNTRSSVYVFDPKTNSWPANRPPNFSTSRKLHAAFIFKRPADNHKLLCVAGGLNTYLASETPLASTQCFDLTQGGSWQGENADLGSLPATRWGMGYAPRLNNGTQSQLWLIGGVLPNLQTSASTLYYAVNGGGWRDGGNLISGVAYRTSAVTLNGEEIIKLGGAFEATQICSADRFKVCSGCQWWTDQTFLPLIMQ